MNIILCLIGMALIVFYCGKIFKDYRLTTLSGGIFGVTSVVWIGMFVGKKYPFVIFIIWAGAAAGFHILLPAEKKDSNKY